MDEQERETLGQEGLLKGGREEEQAGSKAEGDPGAFTYKDQMEEEEEEEEGPEKDPRCWRYGKRARRRHHKVPRGEAISGRREWATMKNAAKGLRDRGRWGWKSVLPQRFWSWKLGMSCLEP